MRRSRADHVVCDANKGGAVVCLHCGQEHRFKFPMEVRAWVKACKAFVTLHRACEAPAPLTTRPT